MSVKIGKNTKIGDNNAIGDNSKVNLSNKSWVERHPILIGIFCSLIAGVVMLFKFWINIIHYIEALFG